MPLGKGRRIYGVSKYAVMRDLKILAVLCRRTSSKGEQKTKNSEKKAFFGGIAKKLQITA